MPDNKVYSDAERKKLELQLESTKVDLKNRWARRLFEKFVAGDVSNTKSAELLKVSNQFLSNEDLKRKIAWIESELARKVTPPDSESSGY